MSLRSIPIKCLWSTDINVKAFHQHFELVFSPCLYLCTMRKVMPLWINQAQCIYLSIDSRVQSVSYVDMILNTFLSPVLIFSDSQLAGHEATGSRRCQSLHSERLYQRHRVPVPNQVPVWDGDQGTFSHTHTHKSVLSLTHWCSDRFKQWGWAIWPMWEYYNVTFFNYS